jgi:hypothetical protein
MARVHIPNIYRIEGDTAILTLTREQETVIDLCDLETVIKYRWSAKYDANGDRYYVVSGSSTRGSHMIYLHRFLMGNPVGVFVDHEDTNSLNNRRHNLRTATRKQNGENRKGAQANSRTGIRGVFIRDDTSYYVQVTHNKKRIRKGSFPKTPEGLREAEQAAIDLRRQLFTHSKECAS